MVLSFKVFFLFKSFNKTFWNVIFVRHVKDKKIYEYTFTEAATEKCS